MSQSLTITPPHQLGRGPWAAARRGGRALAPALAGLAFMLLSVAAFGYDPREAAVALWQGAFGTPERFAATLLVSCPLLIVASGLTVAFRCGVWNIGAEGQYVLGALSAVAVAPHVGRWPAVGAAVVVLAGVVAGGAWAAVAAILRRRRGVPEVLSTILLNFVAVQIVAMAVRGPLVDPTGSDRDTTAAIPSAAELPMLAMPGGLHVGLLLALALPPLLAVILQRTVWGYRLRVVGANATAARYAAIPAERYTGRCFVVSGALAGLAGAVELAGNTHYLTASYGAGYGYTAIAVALLANIRPWGLLPAAIFFAAIDVGARAIQRMPGDASDNVPTVLIFAVQGVAVLATVLFSRTRPRSERGMA